MKFRILLCILSSILLILSFPNFNIEFLAWFALVPWVFAINGLTRKQAFLYSYFVGILFFSGAMWWLCYVSNPGLILLTLYLALYFGLFGLFITHYTLHITLPSLFLLPAMWVNLEYLRSNLFGGFGWALLGYSQYLNLPIIQIADITGAYGVSFLVVMVNVALFQMMVSKWSTDKVVKWSGVISIILILLSLCYGYYKLYHKPSTISHKHIKISLIQGNIPQSEKWDESFKDEILTTYENLTINAARDFPDLIIWPETSLPGFLEEQFINERIISLVRKTEIPLLVGAATLDGQNTFNSAVLFSTDGTMLGKYDKLHLVPFGEYIPFEKYVPFLRDFISKPVGDFTPGKEYVLFKLSPITHKLSTRFGVLICFEDIFPSLLRQFARRKADFMVNITNDAWFGKTSAPYQHAQASVFRAVENRIPVVRSANTGLSCFIDQYGRIFDKVKDDSKEDIFIKGYKTAEVTLFGMPSFYRGYGDVFAILCIIISTLSLFISPPIIK